MKNILLLLTLFIGLQTANAQYVTIPDSNFREALKAKYPACFNAGSQLDTSCSAVINEDSLGVRQKNISSLQGLGYFKNLQKLNCQGNKLASLPVLPRRLVVLQASGNKLTVLPVLPNSLRTLSCFNNNIFSLPPLPDSLIDLEISNNRLLSLLPLLPRSLLSLSFMSCNISYIPDMPRGLVILNCSDNPLSYLPILPETLETIYCQTNNLTSLPELPESLCYLYCSRNHFTSLPTLTNSFKKGDSKIFCGQNPLNCLPVIPDSLSVLDLTATNIRCLPNAMNPNAIYFPDSLPVCNNSSSTCDKYPMVHGKIFRDINSNGIFDSITESFISRQIVKTLPGNWLGASDVRGTYVIKIDTIINNTWSAVNNYRYANITPASYSLANIHSLGLLNGSYDFGVHFIPNIKDLETQLSSSHARRSFTTNVSLNINNVGTINQSNITIKLKKPNGFSLVFSSLTPTLVVNDTMIWKNITIYELQSQSINVGLQVPANSFDTIATYEAWANGTQGDSTPLDNHAKWTQIITGSFDPNDKLVNKATLPPTYNADKDRLLYTIRFQNTGTDTAFTVIVRDEISNNLDVSSLRVVNASHTYQLIVREKNIVEVSFPNIQLPDSNTNEAKSHGFVQLEFKPKAGLPVNAEINNNASIFFDYNEPVITNTAQTKVQITTSVASNRNLAFKLFPNPTFANINVELPYTGNGKWYLTDISGKTIKQNSIENDTTTFNIDVNDVANGTYLLSLEINGNISTSKVVIVR